MGEYESIASEFVGMDEIGAGVGTVHCEYKRQ